MSLSLLLDAPARGDESLVVTSIRRDRDRIEREVCVCQRKTRNYSRGGYIGRRDRKEIERGKRGIFVEGKA